MARRRGNGLGLFVSERPATAKAFDDLELRQAAVDLISAQKLHVHAVMLRTPVFRHIVPGGEGPARRRIAKLVPSQEPLELGLRGVNRDHVEAAAVVRAVLGGGLGRVDLQQDERGFYLSSADMRGDQKIAACPCPREKPFLL